MTKIYAIRVPCPDCGGPLFRDVHTVDSENWFDCYMCTDCGWWVPMLDNKLDRVPPRMYNGRFGVYAEDVEV